MAQRKRTSAKRQAMLERARELYVVHGRPMRDIAEKLDASPNTISNWRKLDEAEQGRSWDEMRSELQSCSDLELLQLFKLRASVLARRGRTASAQQ